MADRLTLVEAAEIAGLEESTLRRAALRGTLQAEKIGPTQRGIWYTTRTALDAYLANRPAHRRDSQPEIRQSP